jgi:cell division septation protein DedD
MLPGLREQQQERDEERHQELEKSQRRQGGAYLVQVSTFREASDAVDLLQELIGEGYDGTLLSRRDREELYHFVQLGPYLTEDRAQQVAREVGVATGLETVVIIEP